ncbi:hypothetical protein [Microcoleus sp. T3B2]|uniref:hypothetical protein n=1 Tax=Microcoleus sp. T3B2 TaxID=3055426 RepID=UPI002FD24E9F
MRSVNDEEGSSATDSLDGCNGCNGCNGCQEEERGKREEGRIINVLTLNFRLSIPDAFMPDGRWPMADGRWPMPNSQFNL